jgi:hypothetical protein
MRPTDHDMTTGPDDLAVTSIGEQGERATPG